MGVTFSQLPNLRELSLPMNAVISVKVYSSVVLFNKVGEAFNLKGFKNCNTLS